MPVRLTHRTELTDVVLANALQALRADVLEEAAHATAELPERNLTDVPFVTLDPKGSRDLDQALHLVRRGSGFVVRYAIADVPGFVTPGGAIDREARLRGQTFYLPDGNIPLHPRILSEDRVSLLPGRERTAYVWEMTLDSSGECTGTHLERAVIMSRHAYDYVGVDRGIRAGKTPDGLELLETVGRLRVEREEARGGATPRTVSIYASLTVRPRLLPRCCRRQHHCFAALGTPSSVHRRPTHQTTPQLRTPRQHILKRCSRRRSLPRTHT